MRMCVSTGANEISHDSTCCPSLGAGETSHNSSCWLNEAA